MADGMQVREGRTDVKPLSDGQKNDLLSLVKSPVWPTVLDLMECLCLEEETNLINVDAADEDRVLAFHKISKASWGHFVKFQKRVQQAVNEYLESVAAPPPPNEVPAVGTALDSPDVAGILDPLK